MRAPLIALFCVLAAGTALLALRGGGEPQEPQPAPSARPPRAIAAEPQQAQSGPLAPTPASVTASAMSPQPQQPVAAARSPGATSAASAVAAAVVKPAPLEAGLVQSTFALSSDHQTLIQETLLAAADHELLEREPRDDAWATESERLIRQELARHGSARDFDVIAVDCRQTLCAIQAFSNGENGHREWVGAVDALYKETLASAFDSVNTAFPTQGSSRSPVLTFLHRKPVAPKR
jgi:hypothetical protein